MMKGQEKEDQLGPGLTDIERLVEVWVDLASSGALCSGITILIAKKVEDLKSANINSHPSVTSENLLRLAAIREQALLLAANHVISIGTTALCEYVITQQTMMHPALNGDLSPRRRGEAELQQLQKLHQWVTMKTSVESSFGDAPTALENLDKVIDYEIRLLRSCIVARDDSTGLKVLEICAIIRKGLSRNQYEFIDRIVAGKISSLKGSKSITIDPTAKSTPTTPSKALAPSQATEIATNEHVAAVVANYEAATQLLGHKIGIFTREKQDLAVKLSESARSLEAETARYHEKLLDIQAQEKRNFEDLITAFKDDRDNYDRSPGDVRKLAEQLSETEHERQSLSNEVDRVDAECARLTKALLDSGETYAKLRDHLQTVTKEKITLEEQRKELSDLMEEAEESVVALSRSVSKLNTENTRLEQEVADIKDDLSRLRSLTSAKNLSSLLLENTALKKEIAVAAESLSQIQQSSSADEINSLNDENLRLKQALAYANDNFSIIHTSLASLSHAISAMNNTTNATLDANEYANAAYWAVEAIDDEYATLDPTTIDGSRSDRAADHAGSI